MTDAIVGISAYVFIGGEMRPPGIDPFETTDDPDEHADSVLNGLHVEPDTLTFRLSGGDDHGDGLTSYDYIAEATLEQVKQFVEWVGDDPATATLNMGLITGPEEYGHIPVGLTFNSEGMDWNMGGVTRYAGVDCSLWPISEGAAKFAFGDDLERLGG